MTKLSGSDGLSLIEIVIIISLLAVLAAIAIPNFYHPCGVSKTAEATGNLSAIKTVQELYHAEYGVYLECKPSPPNGGTSSNLVEWIDAGGFASMGFKPDGDVRYQYEVTVSNDGQSFTATAKGDLDEDGEQAIYTLSLSKESELYPKPIRSGDDF